MRLIDTHSHLYDEAFDADREEALARAAACGVERLLLPAIDSASHERLFDLCRRHPEYCRLAGSDTHRDGDEARTAVILPERVHDSFAYKRMIESRRFHLWSPAFQEFVEADEAIRKEEET